MPTFYFKQKATISYVIDAKDEDEAFAILEGIDPLADGNEIDFEDAELELEEEDTF